jgi:hypothetical protein
MERKWFRNVSGECPVPAGTLIDVEFRDPVVFPAEYGLPALNEFQRTTAAYWELEGASNDIIRWRHSVGEDGWIVNGGEIESAPLYDQTTTVELKLRNGETRIGEACVFYWDHRDDDDYDIVKYREYVEPVVENFDICSDEICADGIHRCNDNEDIHTLIMKVKVEWDDDVTKLVDLIKAQSTVIEMLMEKLENQ